MREMTEEERRVLDYLAQAWNNFLILDEVHPCDRQEFMQAIHAAENIVFARPAIVHERDR